MSQILELGGLVVGPYHSGGGVGYDLADTGRHIEEEGMEINIPRELAESQAIYSFSGTNAAVLNEILKLAGLSITDEVTTVKSGDIVICVRSAWDDTERKFTGTIEEILHKINTSNGCKPIIQPIGSQQSAVGNEQPIKAKNGMKIPFRKKDMEAINPNSDRWKKKKQRIEELSNNIHKLRLNVSRDVQDDDERTALTALVVAVMDRTAERIGNDDSADNGHFGVTGFRKKHISVVGPKVHLDYVGKAGTKHEKSFSDVRIAKALKKAIRNAPGKFIFETSDGFRINADKVNRYLEPFNISAKDLRGYNANKWIIDKLSSQKSQVTSEQPEKAKKERKKIFNKAVKEVAIRVGHGSGTLKKHYMIPELPVQYIEHGRIIDMKNLGYYKEGAVIESPELAKGIEVEKEHKNLYEEIKKRLAAKGIAMPITEQEFYSEIAKVHIKEHKDYYDLLEKYVEKYINENSNPMKNKTRQKMNDGGRVAQEIRRQIGVRALYMLGAHDIFYDGDALIFKIRNSPTAKQIKIELNKKDLYDITFLNWRKKDISDLKTKTIKDVYADQMNSIIEKETGLVTKLSGGGKLEGIKNAGAKIIAKYYDKIVDTIVTIKEELADTGPSKESMLKDLLLQAQEQLSNLITNAPHLLHQAQALNLFDDGGKIVDIENPETLKKETQNISDEEITQLYPVFFEGEEINKNEITPEVKHEVSDKITESVEKLDELQEEAETVSDSSDIENTEEIKPEETETEIIEEITDDEQEPSECGCFFVFIKKENPELVEKIIETDINSNPELRHQFDEEYKKWNGGKI